MPWLDSLNLTRVFGLPIPRISKRLAYLMQRFPLVAIFGVASVVVAFEQLLGKWLSLGLLGALAGTIVIRCLRALSRFGPAKWDPRNPLSNTCLLMLCVAVIFAFYQQRHRIQTEAQVVAWQTQLSRLHNHAIGRNDWEPAVLRGQIAQAISLRPAYVYRKQMTTDSLDLDSLSGGQDVGWQSTTLFQVEQVRDGAIWKPASFLVTLSIDERSDFLPGDRLEIFGKWKLPGVSTNPGQFDSSEFFAQRGLSAMVRLDSVASCQAWSENDTWRFDRFLARVRDLAMKSMEQRVPFGMSKLACALVLGQRDMADWELQEELLATGTIHMLAISGLHVEMISAALMMLGSCVSFRRTLLLPSICFLIWGYSLLCGGNPPVMRAAIMMSLAYLANLMGWQYSSLNNLAAAGLLLILVRPSIVFEVGPQLSFVAVAVLILTTERLASHQTALKKLIWSREARSKRFARGLVGYGQELLRTSSWVWFVTAPIVWNGFHVISPVGILMNLILWFPMMIALVAGLGMIFAGWIPIVGDVLGYLCGSQLWIVDACVQWGERIPLGHFWAPAPPTIWMYGFYVIALVVIGLWGSNRRYSRRTVLFLLGVWFLLGLVYNPIANLCAKLFSTKQPFILTFLDVGHGTNVWLETPDRQLWLYDAGRLGDHERSYRRIADALWHQRYSSIQTLVLSHADSDHYNGMPGLLKRFRVGRFITTSQVASHRGAAIQSLRNLISKQSIPELHWQESSSEDHPLWFAKVIHPPTGWGDGTDNAGSVCLRVEFAGRKVLLPGDLEPPGVQAVLSKPLGKIDVVMAPHHGSLNSKAKELLDWCQPEVVIISGSQRANNEKVRNYFAATNRRVFLTARDHALRVIIHADGHFETMAWQNGKWRDIGMIQQDLD